MILAIFTSSILLSSSAAYAEFEVEYEKDGRKILIYKDDYVSGNKIQGYDMSGNKIQAFENLDANDVEDEIDLFIEIKKPKKEGDPFRVKIEIDDACVKGSTSDEAKMKLGFTTDAPRSLRDWLPDDFIVKNKFFSSKKSSDSNKKIDLVDLPTGAVPIPFPEDPNGEDLIQQDGKKKSFKHKDKLQKIDRQSGWNGKFDFTGPPGEYLMHLIFPAEGIIGELCDGVSAINFNIQIPQFVRNIEVG